VTELNLSFVEIVEADIPELTAVMTRAFDDDAHRHLGMPRGGPEGYDNGDFFRKWLFGYQASTGYKATVDDRIVGAVIVWAFEHGHNYLGTIFVDPAFQNRGVGTRIWQFVEATYPEAVSWTLGTPSWATKSHSFYEHKCGFEKMGEEPDKASFTYRKEMHPAG